MDTNPEIKLLKDAIACLRKTHKALKDSRADVESQQNFHMEKAVESDRKMRVAQSLQETEEAAEYKASKAAHMEIAKSLRPTLQRLEANFQELERSKADFEQKLDAAIEIIERERRSRNPEQFTKGVEEQQDPSLLADADLEAQFALAPCSDEDLDEELRLMKEQLLGPQTQPEPVQKQQEPEQQPSKALLAKLAERRKTRQKAQLPLEQRSEQSPAVQDWDGELENLKRKLEQL